MSLSDTLGSIPGYGGYQAARLRTEAQESSDLEQLGKLQSVVANMEKMRQQQQLTANPAQLKDPEFWSRMAILHNKPEYETHAERLRKDQGNAQTLETMRGVKTTIAPDPQEVAQGADQGTPVPAPVVQRSGGIFDSLEKSNYPSIAQQAQVLKASMEKAPPSIPPQYWQSQQAALAAKETALLNKPEEPLHQVVGKDGKPVLLPRSQAQGMEPYHPPTAASVSLTSEGNLDKEAIRDLAIQSLYDSNALAGYRRDPRMMSMIANERIKVMKETGVTSQDVVSGRAGFKADTGSLNKLTPQYDAITAFENTAKRNGKILVELANKVDSTGIPVAERWIRAGRNAIQGDPDVAKFNGQMNLYRAEAARILTQPNLGGQLTDTARREMEEVIRNSASAKQITEVVGLLERDFDNRKHTLEEQISAIRARMRGRVAPGGGEASPAAPVAPPAAGGIPEFATEADAIKAGIKGKVKIGGRNATIQ